MAELIFKIHVKFEFALSVSSLFIQRPEEGFTSAYSFDSYRSTWTVLGHSAN